MTKVHPLLYFRNIKKMLSSLDHFKVFRSSLGEFSFSKATYHRK